MRTILRNIFSSWLGYVVTVIVGFLLSPYVVRKLGNSGYGVWTLVISLTGYFGMLDLGIRSSVGRFIARHLARNDEERVNQTASSAVVILSLGSCAALLATVVLSTSFGTFKVDAALESSARTALLIAGINVAIALPMGVFGATLIALERFDVTSGVSIVATLLRSGIYVILLRSGKGIVALAAVTLVMGIFEYGALALIAKRIYRPLKFKMTFVRRDIVKELLGFGIFRFVWIVANQLIFYTDSVVIGVFINASAITYFAIAGSLINYGRTVVSLATDTLYPLATKLDSKSDIAGLRRLQIVGTRMALLIGLPICLGYVFLGKQFISLWMGKDYVQSATYLSVLAIAFLTSMSQNTSALILAGMARHRVLAFIALGEGIANLALSILLIRKLGLVGVALGTVIPNVITNGLIVPAYTLRELQMSVWEYITQGVLRPILCILPIGLLCFYFSVSVTDIGWYVFGGEVAAVCLVLAVMTYFVGLTAEQQASLQEKVRNLLGREPVANET